MIEISVMLPEGRSYPVVVGRGVAGELAGYLSETALQPRRAAVVGLGRRCVLPFLDLSYLSYAYRKKRQ